VLAFNAWHRAKANSLRLQKTYELYSSRLQFTNKKAAVLNSGF